MSSLHWFGTFLMMMMMQGSSATRYLVDKEVEIVNPIDLPWNNEVYYMEPDKIDPGFIIMSDHVKIKRVSRDGNTKDLIAGSDVGYREGVGEASNFNIIASFVQLNESIIVVADTNNHCLRSINRETRSTAPFSGRCESKGYQNGGSSGDARYSGPYGLALSETRLFVADNENNAIRILNLVSMMVSSLLRENGRLIMPRYMLLDPAGFMLVSLQNNGIVNVNATSGSLTLLVAQQPGNRDGPLGSTSFGECKGMSWMDRNVAVISDFGNNRIRIVDLSEGSVSTLCRQTTGDGTESDCAFMGVFSVLVDDVRIYVSGLHSVKRYNILRRDVVSLSTSLATPVSGGFSGSSALLPGVISGVVIILALTVAIGVAVWWRKHNSNKSRKASPPDESPGKNPNFGRPLPKPTEEDEYATIDEIASDKVYLNSTNERASLYTIDPVTYSYASLPANSLISSKTDKEPTVTSKSTNIDSNPVAGIPPAPYKQHEYMNSILAPIQDVDISDKYVDMVPPLNENFQSKGHSVERLSLTPDNTESTSNMASADGAPNDQYVDDLY